jgi:hypothetical protein
VSGVSPWLKLKLLPKFPFFQVRPLPVTKPEISRRLKLGEAIREGESVVAADGAKLVLFS